MAVTLTQQPTTPNAAYTNLLYVVSGSATTSNPQYSYVMDIYESGSATRLNRITQVPNPVGVAIFDPSRFLQSQLDYDNHWKITGSIDEVNSVKTFEIKFGEQYGTSISSSITVYPDLTTDELQVFPGIVDPNNGSSFNFNTSSYVGTGNTYLTNFPGSQTTTTVSDPKGYPYIVDSSDYMTVTAFKETVGATGSINVNGYKIQSGSIGPLVDTVSLSGSISDEFVTFGVGPKNLSDLDSAFSASIADGSINTLVTTSDNGGITIMINNNWDGSSIASYDYSKTVQPLGKQYTRFAFINDYGFYDYFNIYSPLGRSSTVEKQNVTLPKVDYSGLTSTYSVETRGETSYYSDNTDTYSITTQWLDKEIANWLEELLTSPEVFIQQGDDFVPVVITNTNFTNNESTARNKTFQYTIDFKPANGRDLVSRVVTPPPITFDPYDNNSIPKSSLLYWYDFSDKNYMTLSGSKYLIEIESKGYHNMSLTTGSSDKYSTDHWIAPELKNGYTSFFGIRYDDVGDKNSALSSRYGNSPNLIDGFRVTDTHTIIMFDKPTYNFTTDPLMKLLSNIEFSNRSGSSDSFEGYKVFRVTNSLSGTECGSQVQFLTGSYYSNTESIISSSGTTIESELGPGGTVYGTLYSYSGSVGGWESKYIKYDGSSYPTSSLSSSRVPSERIASQSFEPYSRTGLSQHENLTVGGFSNELCDGGGTFDLAQLLIYTGSLTDSQITNIITSFKETSPIGSEINAVTN